MERRVLLLAAAAVLWSCGGGSGRPSGPPAPIPDTIRTVTGVIAFQPTGPQFGSVDANGRLMPLPGFTVPLFPRVAPRVPVEVLALDGTVLATGTTDLNGRYEITTNFGNGATATQVRIRVRALLRLPFGMVVRVCPRAGTPEYARESDPRGDPDFDPDFGVMPIDDFVIALNDIAGAFHILEHLYDGLVRAKSGVTGTMRDLDILWEPGNGDRSFLETRTFTPQLTVAGGITGDPASNQDVWDPPVLMRLIGEYLLAFHFADAAPTGTPTDTLLAPSAAWREGFLDWWSCTGRGSAVYWDTEGIGDEGRITRYFVIESFFDPALGSLGPDDINVYQKPANRGIGSAQSVAEVLWDIHDADNLDDDNDGLTFPLFLTLRFLEEINLGGAGYPYLFSLFDRYTSDGTLDPVKLDIIVRMPEPQVATYPATEDNGLLWPPQFKDGVATSLLAGYDGTLADRVDTTGPDVNLDLGLFSKRYFRFNVSGDVTALLTTTGGDLQVEILRLDNTPVASGITSVSALLTSGSYIARVSPRTNPQMVDFTLRLQLFLQ